MISRQRRRLRAGSIVTKLLLILFAFGSIAAQQARGQANIVVDAAWLRGHLKDANLRLLDARSTRDYAAGHLPSAISMPQAKVRATVNGVPGMVAAADVLAKEFGTRGITLDTPVVVYDGQSGLLAARLFWTLEYAGHRNVKILDGGLQGWQAAGGQTVADSPQVTPATFKVTLRPELVISAKEVAAKLKRRDVAIVDARSSGEYTGARKIGKRGGHIPGAKWIEWTNSLTRDQTGMRWKGVAELGAFYRSRGVTPDKEVIVYCQSMVRAAHTYVTLRMLGYDKVRGYDGSWAEWANRDDLPIEK